MSWAGSDEDDFNELFGTQTSQISFGLNNALDKNGPYVPDGNHTLSSMCDYSGGHFWLRLKAGF